MHVEYYPDLLDIVKSLQYNLKTLDSSKILFKRTGEPNPLDVNISFTPVISEKTVEQFIKQDVCISCDRRISYKPGQFSKPAVERPYLVLIHNSFIVTDKRYYDSPPVDLIFRNMIRNGLKCNEKDILVREILRCHFGSDDEKSIYSIQNCKQHIRKDIDRYAIKGILILGQAASLLFNNDTAKISKITGEIIELEGVPAMVCPGPNRIDYMVQKNMDAEKIKSEKTLILNYLQKFQQEIMRS